MTDTDKFGNEIGEPDPPPVTRSRIPNPPPSMMTATEVRRRNREQFDRIDQALAGQAERLRGLPVTSTVPPSVADREEARRLAREGNAPHILDGAGSSFNEVEDRVRIRPPYLNAERGPVQHTIEDFSYSFHIPKEDLDRAPFNVQRRLRTECQHIAQAIGEEMIKRYVRAERISRDNTDSIEYKFEFKVIKSEIYRGIPDDELFDTTLRTPTRGAGTERETT